MLNDLLLLLNSLESHGIAVHPVHPDVKSMKAGPLLRLRLDERGKIVDVEMDGSVDRWTIRDGQQHGFPAVALPKSGLLRLDAADRARINAEWKVAKTEAQRLAVLSQLLQSGVFDDRLDTTWPGDALCGKVRERLELLQTLAADPATASVPATFERFLAAERLLRDLYEVISEEMDGAASDLMGIFFQIMTEGSTLLIDVDMDQFGMASPRFTRNATDARQRWAVSAVLASATGAEAQRGNCALTGRDAVLQYGPFAQPKLPGVGQTYPFSRNSDTPAMARYGHRGSASFPIDASLAAKIAGGLEYLTHSGRRGKSWETIPREHGTDVDLLIASIASIPDLEVAEFLSRNPEEDRADPEDGYIELTSRVIDQLGGDASSPGLAEHIDMLVLRKVDLGNHKVIYHRRMSTADLARAADEWQRANANLPDWFGFPVPVGLGSMEMLRPKPMSPLSIVRISKKRYGEGGAAPVKVGGVSASLAFQCFLRESDARTIARTMLAPIVSQYQPLLVALAAAKKRGATTLKALDPKLALRWDALRAVSWMGILLHQIGRVREDYMSDAAFLLGRLLSAADTMHIRYCYAERKGEIPRDLLGGSLLSMAGKDPMRALGLLQARWHPYWTSGRRSAALTSELKDMASQMVGKIDELEKPVDDRFRAELLLGYLSGVPVKNQSDLAAESPMEIIDGGDDE
ncbi:MAG: hypothetical protein QM589_14310 [Thermomicrobiales bacterium]